MQSSTAVGDFNGDGVDDIAISGFNDLPELGVFFGPLRGNLDGMVPDMTLTTTRYAPYYPYYRTAVETLGDLDGDGSDELVLVAEWEQDDAGAAYVYRGPLRRGTHLLDTDAWTRIRWIHPRANTGRVAPVGDVNGDGRPDLVVQVGNASSDLEVPGQELEMAPLPDGVEVPPFEALDTGSSWSEPEGALMLFTEWRPGDMGPGDAALVIRGSRPGRSFGRGTFAVDDVDGDGMNDFVTTYFTRESTPQASEISVIRPCRDFGELVGPLP
jgi:hypothetical protein